MIKLIHQIFAMQGTHDHPCMKKLRQTVDASWLLRTLKQFAKV